MRCVLLQVGVRQSVCPTGLASVRVQSLGGGVERQGRYSWVGAEFSFGWWWCVMVQAYKAMVERLQSKYRGARLPEA